MKTAQQLAAELKARSLARMQAAKEAQAATSVQPALANHTAPTPAAARPAPKLDLSILDEAIPAAPAAKPAAIVWNTEQLASMAMARSGRPFCLIGSAGSGKTTTEVRIVEEAVRAVADSLHLPLEEIIPSDYVRIVAFTRRAVRNCVKAIRSLGQQYIDCATTAHKALDFQPVHYDVYDDATDSFKQKMRFEPCVNAKSPDTKVRLIIIDEASMLGYKGLFRYLREGFPYAIFIFIGDLNQLRPVMDDPTLGFALHYLDVVELTQVYRQALSSPITAFQYSYTLKGKLPTDADLQAYTTSAQVRTQEAGGKLPEGGTLKFIKMPWGKGMEPATYAKLFVRTYIVPAIKAGLYDPEDATILIPYNKAFGSIEINLEIAQQLGLRREANVYHIIAGINSKYFAVGDFVLHDKRECEIVEIKPNLKFSGGMCKQPSRYLSRTGEFLDEATVCRILGLPVPEHLEPAHEDLDDMFATATAPVTAESIGALAIVDSEDEAAGLKSASHAITLRDRETGVLEEIIGTGDIAALDWSYAMTIHKSQGSEWRKVYLILHESHTMASRESLYTGMTRAAQECVVFYSACKHEAGGNTIARCIKNQGIKGEGWKQKSASYGVQCDEPELMQFRKDANGEPVSYLEFGKNITDWDKTRK